MARGFCTAAVRVLTYGATLRSGIAGLLDGIATSLAGTWGMSDGSAYGTWHISR